MRRRLAALAASVLLHAAHAAPDRAVLTDFPQPALRAEALGVIVNDDDPDSVALAAYYMEKRGIPAANLLHLRFQPGRPALSREEFVNLKRRLDRRTPRHVQAYVLTWSQPWRVDCMSITTAFAFGFDPAFCAKDCKPTRESPYFDSDTSRPFDTHRMRPTMSLAATNLDAARHLIVRGVASDGSNPDGTAYLVSTPDKARNVRAATFHAIRARLGKSFATEIIDADRIEGKADVMFYFTGLAHVPAIERNTYLPGAVADHLTSFGGDLSGNGQMSSLAWIDAGATGSYGTVTEPCNFPSKFPQPGIVMEHYLRGETLIEAYWKSVRMPGQGLFIGEPLARPFAGVGHDGEGGGLMVSARLLTPGLYDVRAAPSMMGPYRRVGRVPVPPGTREIHLRHAAPAYYRFERLEPPGARQATR
jgi:uncharacterized protein (TIGR03790 family)